jgi:small subunit ribosomal protein S7e
MSANALNKIAPNSPSRANPSEIETSIANASYRQLRICDCPY